MRIRSNIFLWGFLAVVLPMLVLALAATYYAQNAHINKVNREISTTLTALSAELERRVHEDRQIALGLSRAAPVQAFIPVLYNVKYQIEHDDVTQLTADVNRYFEGFGTILPGIFYLRVLDAQGNTMVKVSHKTRSKSVYDSIYGYSYVEQEVGSKKFVDRLAQLPANDVSVTVLPHNGAQSELLKDLRLLDYVVPLYSKDEWVGALTVTIIGEHIDQILTHAVRPYNGSLYLIENNPESRNRHGLVLFSDSEKLHLAQARREIINLRSLNMQTFLENIIHQPSGVYKLDSRSDSPASQLHYTELFPYQNSLVNWILTLKIQDAEITEPFNRIRMAIAAIASISLLISLVVTQFWSRQLTRPIYSLMNALRLFGSGDKQQRADISPRIDELKDLADEFNNMAEILSEAEQAREKAEQMMLQTAKLASIGQMAAGIGHEINNPLNNILSYSKLILRAIDSLPEDKRKLMANDLQSLREETLRASEIVKGIMNFARQVPPQYSEFEITPWLENTINFAWQQARENNITLKLYAENLGSIQGDRSQLQQALLNLLLNAIYASPSDATVIIEAKITLNKLVVQVIDQGSGIDKATMQHIFDPFFTTRTEGSGTGLGLSISLGIVEHHNGTLSLENNKGVGGVTATMTLPLQNA